MEAAATDEQRSDITAGQGWKAAVPVPPAAAGWMDPPAPSPPRALCTLQISTLYLD